MLCASGLPNRTISYRGSINGDISTNTRYIFLKLLKWVSKCGRFAGCGREGKCAENDGESEKTTMQRSAPGNFLQLWCCALFVQRFSFFSWHGLQAASRTIARNYLVIGSNDVGGFFSLMAINIGGTIQLYLTAVGNSIVHNLLKVLIATITIKDLVNEKLLQIIFDRFSLICCESIPTVL